MKRWKSDDATVRMWTTAAGTVVDEGQGDVVLAVSSGEVRLSQEAAAELAEALIEATTGKVPE